MSATSGRHVPHSAIVVVRPRFVARAWAEPMVPVGTDVVAIRVVRPTSGGYGRVGAAVYPVASMREGER